MTEDLEDDSDDYREHREGLMVRVQVNTRWNLSPTRYSGLAQKPRTPITEESLVETASLPGEGLSPTNGPRDHRMEGEPEVWNHGPLKLISDFGHFDLKKRRR